MVTNESPESTLGDFCLCFYCGWYNLRNNSVLKISHALLKNSSCMAIAKHYRQWDCTWCGQKTFSRLRWWLLSEVRVLALKDENLRWDHLNPCRPDMVMCVCNLELPVVRWQTETGESAESSWTTYSENEHFSTRTKGNCIHNTTHTPGCTHIQASTRTNFSLTHTCPPYPHVHHTHIH